MTPTGIEPAAPQAEETEPVPFMQRVLDDPFLLLFLGVAIPTVLYIVWGVMEVASIPLAQ
ncbi:hypothetical protein [Microvirga massiliensis]|jgi:hypothetical protein|uniref:hypothetical protein n=1 Tax=Microvirga massiliensis TaxID=1033741 RepID=UPI00062BB054|nr:hypothetical protein [Microvirga massiliensis]